jgi:hypothetical protein
MASPPDPSPPVEAIGGHYVVDVAKPLPLAGGGVPAYAATDRRNGHASVMALHVDRHAPARARPLQVLTAPIESLLTPLAHGKGPAVAGDAGYFVICQCPPGAPLSASLQPWSEASLIEYVLLPVANVLDQLRASGITHRAIRADNVFQAQRGQPVVLGAAWAAPAAMHQPAIYEPPYSAMCRPTGRGDGSISDDIYALGALLVVLSLGQVPLAGADDATVVQRKLEFGSYTALVGDARLPPGIADLASGMLAEDPEHRPPLKLLHDLAAARGRKVATRPPHRAARPLQIGKTAVWNLRMLAYAIGSEPEAGVQALCGASLMPWLRRGLGEAALAVRVEEMLRFRHDKSSDGDRRPDMLTVMHIVAMLDPLAPLCWNGVILWPDGIGPAMAAALARDPGALTNLEALVTSEGAASWGLLRDERCDAAHLRLEARQQRVWLQQRGAAGGVSRLAYMLNPMMPCGGKLAAGRWVASLLDVPAALEATASGVDVLDPHVVAFIAARADRRLALDVNALNVTDPDSRLVAQLRLLSELQQRFDTRPLPGLAGWFAAQATPLMSRWKNRSKRAVVAERLVSLAAGGELAPMLSLIEDPAGHAADSDAADRAAAELARIDRELAAIEGGGGERAAAAARSGQEIAAGIGLAALAIMLIMAAF